MRTVHDSKVCPGFGTIVCPFESASCPSGSFLSARLSRRTCLTRVDGAGTLDLAAQFRRELFGRGESHQALPIRFRTALLIT